MQSQVCFALGLCESEESRRTQNRTIDPHKGRSTDLPFAFCQTTQRQRSTLRGFIPSGRS